LRALHINAQARFHRVGVKSVQRRRRLRLGLSADGMLGRPAAGFYGSPRGFRGAAERSGAVLRGGPLLQPARAAVQHPR
jgi:hypothetical protein